MFIKSDDIQLRVDDYHAQSIQILIKNKNKKIIFIFLYNHSKKTKIRQL